MRIVAPSAVVLDSTPLGLLTQREGVTEADVCRAWYVSLLTSGCLFFVPEIADYEMRREMRRKRNDGAVRRLDAFSSAAPERYLPLTTSAVRLAADMWAQARQTGHVTAPPEALDADVLIAAQARLLVPADFGLADMVVATENAKHFQGLRLLFFGANFSLNAL